MLYESCIGHIHVVWLQIRVPMSWKLVSLGFFFRHTYSRTPNNFNQQCIVIMYFFCNWSSFAVDYLLNFYPAGFQFVDALLCCACLCREHSEIRIASIFLGKCQCTSQQKLDLYSLIWKSISKFLTLFMSLQSCVLAPSTKSEKKIRSILEGLCDSTHRQVKMS